MDEELLPSLESPVTVSDFKDKIGDALSKIDEFVTATIKAWMACDALLGQEGVDNKALIKDFEKSDRPLYRDYRNSVTNSVNSVIGSINVL